MKTIALRLEDDLHAKASAIAGIEEVNLSEFIRGAISTAVEDKMRFLPKEKISEALKALDDEIDARRNALRSLLEAPE